MSTKALYTVLQSYTQERIRRTEAYLLPVNLSAKLVWCMQARLSGLRSDLKSINAIFTKQDWWSDMSNTRTFHFISIFDSLYGKLSLEINVKHLCIK